MKTRLIISRILFSVLIFLVPTSHSNSEKYPERIISLSPSITEIIYGLESIDKIVGVTIYSDFPQEVKQIPKVGGWTNPNLEQIIILQPDLIFIMKDQDSMFGDNIRKLGLDTFTVDSDESIEDIKKSIRAIGNALGKNDEASDLINSFVASLDDIKKTTNQFPPKRVLFVIGRHHSSLEDVYVIGKNNFINEIIEIAGGKNVVENERLALKISKEAILSLSPDVIVEVNHERAQKIEKIIEIWSVLNEVPAVKNKEVYVISSTILIHPSQRIAEGAKLIANKLHPEAFKRYGKNN